MELRERVAKAVHDSGPHFTAWDKMPQWQREHGLKGADAAIAAVLEAMGEPSIAVVEASVFEKGCGCPCCNTSDDWRAMLAAFRTEALGESK